VAAARRIQESALAATHSQKGENAMSLSLILLIVLILLLVGALPSWPYSAGWGYWPSGGLGLVLLVVIVLFLMGRI
jgi:membrane protein YdbS with pleckstrin-like domain